MKTRSRKLPIYPTGRARAPGVSDRIMRLAVGATLSLATNGQAIRAAASIISRNTGRQFTVDGGQLKRVG